MMCSRVARIVLSFSVLAACSSLGCGDGEQPDTGQDPPDTTMTTPSVCGDWVCDAGENGVDCPVDCIPGWPRCGDGECRGGEDSDSCPADCPVSVPETMCGDGTCEEGEDETSCAQDCAPAGPECGDAVCEEGESRRSCMQDCRDQWTPEDDFVVTFRLADEVMADTGRIALRLLVDRTEYAQFDPEFSEAPYETFSYEVDWDGDGTFDEQGTSDPQQPFVRLSHDYGCAGNFTARFRGTFGGFANVNPEIEIEDLGLCVGGSQQVLDVVQWGTLEWRSMEWLFKKCTRLTSWSATDLPMTSAMESTAQMFSGTPLFDHPLDDWDVSSVTNMTWMFKNAEAFNQPLDAWDTSAVTEMMFTFQGASAFNQPLDSWDTSSVESMSAMFEGASAFNQPIGSWDTSSVRDMSRMFQDAASFNQLIGSWGTSLVYDMSAMFKNARVFDQPIGSWSTGAVEDMSGMFEGAYKFNRSLGRWDVSSVTDMTGMLDTTALSTQYYDATLSGWAAQSSLEQDVTLGASGRAYCQAEGAREKLQSSPTFWIIRGDRFSCN